MKSIRWLMSVVLVVFVAVTPARAQDATEDDDDLYRASELLTAPLDLQRAKRREARDTKQWVTGIVATAAAGFDSNVHESPANRRDSAFESLGAALDARKYIGDSHRLTLDMEARGRRYQESPAASPYRFEGGAFYGYRPDADYSLSLSASVKHRNDSATTIDGAELGRNFEYTAYRSAASLWLYASHGQALRLSYSGQRRDFTETPAMGSLDWWKHGPDLSYRVRWDNGVRWEASYSLLVQHYDVEPAGDRSGAELPGYPAEKHYFHSAATELQAPLGQSANLTLLYEFERKDDRFLDYESYSGHTADAEIDWAPASKWSVHLDARFRHRDYDNRPGAGTAKLEYDRWTGLLVGAYQVTEHVAVFASYEVEYRDTNRSADARTYRDYLRHVALSGVSMAY